MNPVYELPFTHHMDSHTTQQGRAETFGGAGAQNIKGAHKNKALNRAVHKIS